MLTRVTLNGLAGRVVARGPLVAHPCANLTVCKDFYLLFCKRRVGHICPIRLFLSQPSGSHMSH